MSLNVYVQYSYTCISFLFSKQSTLAIYMQGRTIEIYLFITDEGMTLPYLLARGSCMHMLIKSLHQKHVLVKITSTMLFQLLTPVEQLKYSQS